MLVCVLWIAFAAYSTYTAPIVDCYERAVWNGSVFVGTGDWKCLK